MRSIQWGGWAGGGMASGDSSTAGRLARMGMPLITPSQGLAALATALTSVCYLLTAVPFAWSTFLSHPSNKANPAYSDFTSTEQHTSTLMPPAKTSTHLQASNAEEHTLSRDALLGQIAVMVETVVGQAVGHDEPLMAAGLDSLGTVELRNTLESRLGLQLPATLVRLIMPFSLFSNPCCALCFISIAAYFTVSTLGCSQHLQASSATVLQATALTCCCQL